MDRHVGQMGRLLLAGLLVVGACPNGELPAGELNAIRSRVRKEKKEKPRRDPDRDSEDSDSDQNKSAARLDPIRAEVRRPEANGRREPRHRNRYPARSPGSLGMYFSSPAWNVSPYPVVAEQHVHLYEAAPVADGSVVTETPYLLDELPPPARVPMSAEPLVEFADPWTVRVDTEYASNLGQLSRFGLNGLAQAPQGLGIDFGVRLNWEQDLGIRDQLWLGDVNLMFELSRTERFSFRAGIGLNWLADVYGAETGLNLTVGSDWFVAPKLVLVGELDVGTLGAASLFHGRLTAGYRLERAELFAGYDRLDIGGVGIDSLVSGVRFRF